MISFQMCIILWENTHNELNAIRIIKKKSAFLKLSELKGKERREKGGKRAALYFIGWMNKNE